MFAPSVIKNKCGDPYIQPAYVGPSGYQAGGVLLPELCLKIDPRVHYGTHQPGEGWANLGTVDLDAGDWRVFYIQGAALVYVTGPNMWNYGLHSGGEYYYGAAGYLDSSDVWHSFAGFIDNSGSGYATHDMAEDNSIGKFTDFTHPGGQLRYGFYDWIWNDNEGEIEYAFCRVA